MLEPEIADRQAKRELAEVTALADPEAGTEADVDEAAVLLNRDEEVADSAEEEERTERDGEDKRADAGVPEDGGHEYRV